MIKRSLKTVESLFYQGYYNLAWKPSKEKKPNAEGHIVVSLTSFPARFKTLHYALKSALNQTRKPDAVFLVLTKEEVKNESELPRSVLELKKDGVDIFFADHNLKPHNKYLYAMKQFPNSLVVTIDDDNIYDRNLLRDLYRSYLKHPKAISAKRVHKIRKDENNLLLPYSKWHYEYKKEVEPSYDLLATGVGGVLYPPGLLPAETFDIETIKKYSLNADDIWLKFMELKNKIPVAWVKSGRTHPVSITNTQKISLQQNNFHEGQNDRYIAGLEKYCGIDLASCSESAI